MRFDEMNRRMLDRIKEELKEKKIVYEYDFQNIAFIINGNMFEEKEYLDSYLAEQEVI
ncbi:hypothetical protein [Gracilibacillus sp. YIM 98692]|uniref:hypothetical protein n=1 Tax=Gracilibacillus sp. YIM 98692 TaxID=2663532 RepID=UPI0013D2AFBC|nr:hypothetical protein [Gracilibacillus sp. YIM 98692]